MKSIINFFSLRKNAWLFISIAVASRIINILFVSYSGRDKMFLVLQSKSLLDGKGLGVPEHFTTNPDIPVYDYTPMWPPGYPVTLAPFLKIFNYDVYWATTTLDIIACIAFIFLIRKICRQINFSEIAINLMTLVAGCFEYTFISDSKPTDDIPIVIFLYGISLVIKLVSADRFKFSTLFFTAFILFLPGVFRYSYPPLAIAVAVSVLFAGFIKKENWLMKKGAWLAVLTFLLSASFLFTMKLITGYMGYAVPTPRGYFPENLIHWFPLVPASFMNISFLTSQSYHVAGLSTAVTFFFLEVINIIAVLFILSVFLYLLFNKKFLAVLTPFKWFLLTGFFAAATIFVSLGYLSFTYEVQRGLVSDWSYVQDDRYYAFGVVFLQLAFFGWISIYKETLKNIFYKIIAITCSLFLFIEITHNIYFHTKVGVNFKEYKSKVYREQDYVYFFNLVEELEKKYPGYAIWSTSPGDFFYQYTASYRGHRGIMDAASFKDKKIKVEKKTILTLMVYDFEMPAYKDFISRSTVLSSKKIDISNIYVIELLP